MVSPGLIKTEFAETKLGSKEQAEDLYSTNPHLLPEDVAESVLYILSAPPHVDVNDILVLLNIHKRLANHSSPADAPY